MPLLVVAGIALATPAARAQGGHCSNNNINLAFNTALHRAPNGSGVSGECNPANYGGGAWSNQNDLVRRVGAAVYCSNNPWIGQIYLYEYNRYPNWSECTTNYGYAPSYMALDSAIKIYVSRPKAPAGDYLVLPNGSLVDSTGTVVATAGSYVIAAGGANVIAAGGANVIAAGGANIVVPQAGMVIAAGGANLANQRSVFSNGKRVIAATIVRR